MAEAEFAGVADAGPADLTYKDTNGMIWPFSIQKCLGGKLYALFKTPMTYQSCYFLSALTGLQLPAVDNLNLQPLTTCFQPASFWDGSVNGVCFNATLWSEYPGVAVPGVPGEQHSCLLQFARTQPVCPQLPPPPPPPPVCDPGNVSVIAQDGSNIGKGELCIKLEKNSAKYTFDGTLESSPQSGKQVTFVSAEGEVATASYYTCNTFEDGEFAVANTFAETGTASYVGTVVNENDFYGQQQQQVKAFADVNLATVETADVTDVFGKTVGMATVKYALRKDAAGRKSILAVHDIRYTREAPHISYFKSESVRSVITKFGGKFTIAEVIRIAGTEYAGTAKPGCEPAPGIECPYALVLSSLL